MNSRMPVVVSIVAACLIACCIGPRRPPAAANRGPRQDAPPQQQEQKPQPEVVKTSKTKFNEEVIAKYKLTEREFPSLQYYVAADLVISREVSKEESKKPTKGKLVQSKGQVIEEIGILSGTPGVCVKAETDKDNVSWMNMSFEAGTAIWFRRRSTEEAYTASCSDKGVNAEIRFLGNVYKTSPDAVRAAYLVVGEQSLENYQKKRKDLKGVELPN